MPLPPGKILYLNTVFAGTTAYTAGSISRAVPQKDADGNIQMWVGTSNDIEEQKAFTHDLSKQVQERTTELEQKNKELEKMNVELQSFSFVCTHDLQEPLRKIQTFASRIFENENKNLSENGKHYFKRMQEAANRMQTLIRDLLSYSHTNTTEKIFEKTDLKQLLAEIKEELKETLAEKKVTLEIIKTCEATIIPFQFRQLMHNLIGNSLKFSKPGTPPHITINAELIKPEAMSPDKNVLPH